MTHPRDCTAAELADRLDYLTLRGPNTGMASILDEAALPFARKSGEVALASRAFSAARGTHMRSYSPATGDNAPEKWDALTDAARALAAALRPLGELTIARCPECGVSLGGDGVCRMSDDFHPSKTRA
jgi:hypothetical protein